MKEDSTSLKLTPDSLNQFLLKSGSDYEKVAKLHYSVVKLSEVVLALENKVKGLEEAEKIRVAKEKILRDPNFINLEGE